MGSKFGLDSIVGKCSSCSSAIPASLLPAELISTQKGHPIICAAGCGQPLEARFDHRRCADSPSQPRIGHQDLRPVPHHESRGDDSTIRLTRALKYRFHTDRGDSMDQFLPAGTETGTARAMGAPEDAARLIGWLVCD